MEDFFSTKMNSKESLSKVSSHSSCLELWKTMPTTIAGSSPAILPPPPPHTFPQVPSLNSTPLDSLPPSCLVRYRCMVQDQFDPEFYLKVYHTTNTHTGNTVSTLLITCG